LAERVRVSYAEGGTRHNPWIKFFSGRFETENGELVLEAKALEEVERIVAQQLDYFNRKRRHS
jgi:hypothetical protein